MDGRKYLILLALMIAAVSSWAQVSRSAQADSITYAQYQAGQWEQLIITGLQLVNEGTDFPLLRLRIGYALVMTGDYAGALAQYQAIVDKDPGNQTARYYLNLCHKYLNHDLYARYQACYLDTTVIKHHPLDANNFDFESSVKIADNKYRGNATYNRVGLSLLAGKRLQIDQSLAYFSQKIYSREDVARRGDPDDQTEYFLKANFALSGNLSLLGGWHYLYTSYHDGTYNSNVLLGGINYASGYFDLQADADFGLVVKDRISQYNGILKVYPTGNLNLYTLSRLSYHHESGADGLIFNQAVGFKAVNQVWLETSATFGDLDDYVDADGLYIYNAFDNTKFKAGETLYYQAGAHALLQLNYTFESKLDVQQSIHYQQHSITAGILWKF